MRQVPGNVTDITRIQGDLTISGTISSFPDFATLAVVEGNLNINEITTAGLIALSGIFPALDSVYGHLQIQNQRVVETIAGFATLDTIGLDLNIDANTSLTTLPTFSALKGVGEDIFISSNPALRTVSGFEALTVINETITIGSFSGTRNTLLETVSGFGALKRIGDCLNVVSNPALTTINSFPALETIGYDLWFDNNIKLTTVSGFGSLMRIGRTFLIRDNVALSSCCALLRFVDGTVDPGSTTISGNATGCSTKAQITTDCTPTTIIGTDLEIANDGQVPGNVTDITRIKGNLIIGRSIASFP